MIIAVYKPKGPTSNKFLTQIKRIVKIKKVGHAGTLDPLASGILVIGIGRESTKKLSTEVQKEKEYTAKIKLGEKSITDDEEGEKTIQKVDTPPLFSEVLKILNSFLGEIDQTPPIYSAVKIRGREAYKYARKNQTVKINPRKALIKDIEVISYQYPFLEIKVTTGPGVYIRSLARDIGQKLKTGAYLAELERIRVGEFTKDNVTSLKDLPDLLTTI